MKKLILMLTVCTFAIAGTVSAQRVLATGKVILQAVDGKETVEIVTNGDAISEVHFIDAAGKKTKLLPARGVIPGAPRPGCNSKNPALFFNSAAKNIGLVICTDGDPTAAGNKTREFRLLNTMDMTGQPDAAGKAQNRRVEVKLSK